MPNFVKIAKGIYPFGANLYQKFAILAVFAPVSLHFRATTLNFGVGLRTFDTLPAPNFVKNTLTNRSRVLPVLHWLGEVMHIGFDT